MSIRRATPEDIPQIVAIEQIPEFRSYIGSWSAEEHPRTMTSRDAEYFVAATEPDAIDGYAILQGLESADRSVQLRRLAVRTPNRGLGRLLLDFVAARVFRDHQAHRLWLDVFAANQRARRIYESFGFQYEGTLREAILRDGAYHSQMLMSMLDREHAARDSPTKSR